MTINDKHIAYIEKVNNSKTIQEHFENTLILEIWRRGVSDAGVKLSCLDADIFYIDQGIDRPMCCGVWLDWLPHDFIN